MTRESYDVTVIGGGPAGGHTASIIAKAGYKVAIIEEHRNIGQPVQCAGLITPRCFDILGYGKGTILNELKGADISSPKGGILSIGKQKVQALAIDRAAFDKAIVDHAISCGATLLNGERVSDIRIGNSCVVGVGDKTIESKLVIGADGARSLTRKCLGLEEPEHFLTGFGAEVSGLNLDNDRVRIFFGRELAPNFFAWAIPVGETARVGLCVRDGVGTVHEYFKRYLATLNPNGEVKVTVSHSGIIPLGHLKRTYADHAMLVGDAAGQVKATSGGGIYPGLVCGNHCARAAITALEKDDFTAQSLSGYHKAWTQDIGDELEKAMMIHRMFSNLGDAELEDIFGI